MGSQKKLDIEKKKDHKFCSTGFQYERLAKFSSECGITVSQLFQKIADLLQDEKDKTRLMKLLKLTEVDSITQKKFRDQRAGRTGLFRY